MPITRSSPFSSRVDVAEMPRGEATTMEGEQAGDVKFWQFRPRLSMKKMSHTNVRVGECSRRPGCVFTIVCSSL